MIYAFGHQKYCGKDSSARFLETHLRVAHPKLIVRKRSFAASLKSACAQLYGWAGLKDGIFYENNPPLKDEPLPGLPDMSARKIWIAFGNSVRDGVHPDTFVRKVLSEHKAGEVLIITDLRYPNEAKLIQEAKGWCILVQRPGLPVPTDVADTALDSFTEWDAAIDNSGSLGDLDNTILALTVRMHK